MIEMTAEMADKAVKAAQAKARELNAYMTVSVVDESGRLVMTVRGNGCGYFTTDTSRGKATLSAALRRSTKAMIERGPSAFIQSLPGLLPGQVLPSGGAVPIFKDGRCIGAIGCGGGTSDEDHECATAGAQAIGSPTP